MTDKSITLTIREIFDLARAAQLIPHKALLSESILSDEEPDTEYTIFEREGGVIVKDDDGTPRTYLHGVYLDEYPDEGTFPLGEAGLRTNDASAAGARGASTEIQTVPESAGQSDTPEADAFLLARHDRNIAWTDEEKDFSRTLERQRDQFKLQAKLAIESAEILGALRDKLTDDLATVTAKKDEALSKLNSRVIP